MWICTEGFHVPKHGNAEAEYEDAYFPRGGCARELSEFRCAVADGASESAFSGLWAQVLVRGFSRRRLRLARLRKLWSRAVGGNGAQPADKALPWYLEKKVASGAHAAFVGLHLRDRAWRAVAVGDSCLFHVRGDELLAVGPVDRAEAFNNNPFLLSSKAEQSIRRADEHVRVLEGAWRSGDTFYLATDAISQWLLAEHEAGRNPWPMLRVLDRGDEAPRFDALVARLREQGALNNDDTTLMRIEVA